MNSQTRLLPRLDQLYLQKKSYEAHKKKLISIQRSGSFSKRSLNQSSLQQNEEDATSNHSLSQSTLKLMELSSAEKVNNSVCGNRMETIQQAKPGLSYWLKKMNPLQKRLKQEQIKQNKRIREKIKNTMSFIQQSNKIDSHAEHYKGMKNMLNKFQIDHESKKTKLKCEIVLKKITEIEKQKLRMQESRILQFQSKQKSSEKLTKMSKHNQLLSKKIQQKEKENSSNKRTRMLSEQIDLITRQTTGKMKNATILKNNFVQSQKDSILMRNRSELTSKSNQHLRNPKDSKTFTPKLGNSEKYQRLKTEYMAKNESKRLFNSSKLSNLSSETAPQVASLKKQYKVLKVNFTHQGQLGFKRVPNAHAEHRYKKQRSSSPTQQPKTKNYIASRIRTEVTQNSKAVSLNRSNNIKQFDYQKKRIERYIKSKSSLSVKDINNKYKAQGVIKNGDKAKQRIIEEKRPSIVEEKIEESMQTIEHAQKQESKSKIIKTQSKQDGQTTYFATQIQ